MTDLNKDLVVRAINYHGEQLRGFIRDTQQILFMNVDYQLFKQRREDVNLESRKRQLALHRFIAKNLPSLFRNIQADENVRNEIRDETEEYAAVMPPYEAFYNVDPGDRLTHFFEDVAVGDIIIARVENLVSGGDTQLSMQCFDPATEKSRYIEDLDIKCICSMFEMITLGTCRGDLIRLVIREVRKCEQKLVGSIEKQFLGASKRQNVKLGLFPVRDVPSVYSCTRKAVERGLKYETLLEKSPGFHNPTNVVALCQDLCIDSSFSSLVVGFSRKENNKKCIAHLANGIHLYKEGKNKEAFEHLNNALNIEPSNPEALLARGVLLSNDGAFDVALDDFEKALQINPNHQKAQKYIRETLVLLAKNPKDNKKPISMRSSVSDVDEKEIKTKENEKIKSKAKSVNEIRTIKHLSFSLSESEDSDQSIILRSVSDVDKEIKPKNEEKIESKANSEIEIRSIKFIKEKNINEVDTHSGNLFKRLGKKNLEPKPKTVLQLDPKHKVDLQQVKVPGDLERAANVVERINKKIEERKRLDESYKKKCSNKMVDCSSETWSKVSKSKSDVSTNWKESRECPNKVGRSLEEESHTNRRKTAIIRTDGEERRNNNRLMESSNNGSPHRKSKERPKSNKISSETGTSLSRKRRTSLKDLKGTDQKSRKIFENNYERKEGTSAGVDCIRKQGQLNTYEIHNKNSSKGQHLPFNLHGKLDTPTVGGSSVETNHPETLQLPAPVPARSYVRKPRVVNGFSTVSEKLPV